MRFLEKLKAYIKELGEDEGDFTEEESESRPQPPKESRDRSPNPRTVRDLPETVPPVTRIEVFRPNRYKDCQQIADALKAGHAVVVDYYYTLESTAKRMRCFMSGFIYAIEGCEERLSAHVFVYTPYHAGIQSGPKRSTRDNTLHFPWGR